MKLRFIAPGWGLLPALAVVLMCAVAVPAAAQPKSRSAKNEKSSAASDPKGKADAKTDGKADPKKAPDKVKTFDFDALDLNGRMRTPQLLYFLERANEELERASLEKRSFIPHLVRSLEEESL
ncbi:MAG: hypothetical protein AB7O24_21755 [Kofleriaceae bacterium]